MHEGKKFKAPRQISARHQGKLVQGTYAGQCNAPGQGSAAHLGNVVQGT